VGATTLLVRSRGLPLPADAAKRIHVGEWLCGRLGPPLAEFEVRVVPWADIAGHPLPGQPGRTGPICPGPVHRHPAPPGGPALPEGNEQASGCPVPDVASGATRRIIGWRLDRERLAAVIAAAAPEIPVIAFTAGPKPGY
jgi:hypothetical protein